MMAAKHFTWTTRRLLYVIAMIGLSFGATITCQRAIGNRVTIKKDSGQRISKLRIVVNGTFSVVEFNENPPGDEMTSAYGMRWGIRGLRRACRRHQTGRGVWLSDERNA